MEILLCAILGFAEILNRLLVRPLQRGHLPIVDTLGRSRRCPLYRGFFWNYEQFLLAHLKYFCFTVFKMHVMDWKVMNSCILCGFSWNKLKKLFFVLLFPLLVGFFIFNILKILPEDLLNDFNCLKILLHEILKFHVTWFGNTQHFDDILIL